MSTGCLYPFVTQNAAAGERQENQRRRDMNDNRDMIARIWNDRQGFEPEDEEIDEEWSQDDWETEKGDCERREDSFREQGLL